MVILIRTIILELSSKNTKNLDARLVTLCDGQSSACMISFTQTSELSIMVRARKLLVIAVTSDYQ